MARPERRDADYFPFYAKDGRTLFVLQHKFGLEGIGFFTNLMRLLTTTTDHHISLEDEGDRLYTFSRIGCDEERGVAILDAMAATGKIDKQLWNEYRVVVSEDLIESLKAAYEKRANEVVTLEQIRAHYTGEDVSGAGNPATGEFPGPETPQDESLRGQKPTKERKGKESKGKERKGEETPPPSLFDFVVNQKQGSMRNPEQFARKVEKNPEAYPDILEEYRSQSQARRQRAGPPTPCPECGSARLRTSYEVAECLDCGAHWDYNPDENAWILSPETAQRSMDSVLHLEPAGAARARDGPAKSDDAVPWG